MPQPTSTTDPSPTPSPDPRPGRASGESVADRRVMAVVTALIVSITLLQRFGLPLGGVQLSVSVLVALAGLGYLLHHGDVVENRPATRVFVLAVAAAFLCAGIVLFRTGEGAITSLVYLPVIWVVFTFRLHPARHHLYERVLARFEAFMLVFAAVGILQTAGQALGVWSYRDFVLSAVPRTVLFTGYNTSYPIEYGNPIIKANGFVFLEPSIYAQFLAIALLAVLVRRAAWWRVVVLAIALVCTISGTGLLFAGFGVLLLMLRRGGRWTARIVVAVVVAIPIALATPFGSIIAERAGETSQTNSSGSLRFVQPYGQILQTWGDRPWSVLVGDGAGRADRLADEIFQATRLPINFSGLAKLVLEYGLPAAVLFGVFAALALVRRSPSPTLAGAGVFANAFLTGALLQPQVLYVLVPLSSLFIGYRYEAGRDARRDPAASGPASGGGESGQGAPVAVTVAPASPNGLTPPTP
ncbi:hypothetical protein AB2L28_09590 [Kineococcus sp. TBRC 1896]|uniref:O-antigen ligase n=1 Tax=Kineococcus mangrovi TaxID=1660183 RepID=A0ABV4I1D7_9ACTN